MGLEKWERISAYLTRQAVPFNAYGSRGQDTSPSGWRAAQGRPGLADTPQAVPLLSLHTSALDHLLYVRLCVCALNKRKQNTPKPEKPHLASSALLYKTRAEEVRGAGAATLTFTTDVFTFIFPQEERKCRLSI